MEYQNKGEHNGYLMVQAIPGNDNDKKTLALFNGEVNFQHPQIVSVLHEVEAFAAKEGYKIHTVDIPNHEGLFPVKIHKDLFD